MNAALQAGPDAHGIVGSYLRRFGWLRARLAPDQLDDLWAELLLECVHALATWRPDAGRGRVSWCWWHLHRRAGRWWQKQQRWQAMEPLRPEDDPAWLARFVAREDGYQQAEDRDQLQRLADRVQLTDSQADAVEWFAVHGGTPTRHVGGHGRWFPEYSRSWPQGWAKAFDGFRRAHHAGELRHKQAA